MDLDESTIIALIKQRHAELVAQARRDVVLRAGARRRRALRLTLGTALIRAGAWLLRRDYARA